MPNCFMNERGAIVFSAEHADKLGALAHETGRPVPFQNRGPNIYIGARVNPNSFFLFFHDDIYDGGHSWRPPYGEDKDMFQFKVLHPDGRVVEAVYQCQSCSNQLTCKINGGPKSWVKNPSTRFKYFKTSCPLTSFAELSTAAKRSHLRAVGFEIGKAYNHFRGDQAGDYELDVADKVESISWEALVDVGAQRLMDQQEHFLKKPAIADMVFDSREVKANKLISIATKHSGAVRSAEVKNFKKNVCSQCVYQCGHPPYDMKPCAVTETDLFADVVVTEADLVWATKFTFSGPTRVGKRRFCVWGPDGRDGFVVKNLSPPFHDSERVWEPESKDIQHYLKMIKDNDKDLRPTLWALRILSQELRYEGRIKKLHGDEFGRNDFLAIQLCPNTLEITVHSDTRASSCRFGGGSITAEDRPRYRSPFPYPYYPSIQKRLGLTPGSTR